MCKHIEDNTYDISLGINVRNVSDSKCDIQGQPRSLAMVRIGAIR